MDTHSTISRSHDLTTEHIVVGTVIGLVVGLDDRSVPKYKYESPCKVCRAERRSVCT